MTKIEITIQNGKVTWVDKSGDELDYEKWTELNLALARIFDSLIDKVTGKTRKIWTAEI